MKKSTTMAALLVLLMTTTGLAEEPLFGAGVYYNGCEDNSTLFAADLDGDYDIDIVTSGGFDLQSFFDALVLWRNNGDGTFAMEGCAYTMNWCWENTSICGADFNGDGLIDVAHTGAYAWQFISVECDWLFKGVSIYLNDGNGELFRYYEYDLDEFPGSICTADLDGDGDYDLAVIVSGIVGVMLNNGNGTFQSAVYYAAGDAAVSVFGCDLDGDGDADLAVGNASDNISILESNGDGTFAAAVDYPVGNAPVSIFGCDLDGDGDADLAVANGGSDNIAILSNHGDGTFSDAVFYTVGDGPGSVFSADFDNDNHLDLVVANRDSDNISVMLNNGDGTFAAPVNQAVPYPLSVFSADFDGDGDNDLAMVGDGLTVLFNRTICCRLRGDSNHSGGFNSADVIYLVDYMWKGGSAPYCDEEADADGSGTVNSADVIYLVDYFWKGGPPPVPCP